MDTGARSFGPASLRIRRTDAFPLYLRDAIRELYSLQVPASEQRNGYATNLMNQVCREADAYSIVLVLLVEPFLNCSLSRTEIAAWYALKFGFVTIQPEPMMMARQPCLGNVKPLVLSVMECCE